MKCPKCGAEMQEEGEMIDDEDGEYWAGYGVYGCPKCGYEVKE